MAGYAIVVRYHGPTNYRGSRWIATGPALTSDDARDMRYTRATVPYDYAAGDAGRSAAAERIAETLRAAGWNVALGAHATLPDGAYVFLLDYGRGPIDDLGIAYADMTAAEYARARHAALYPAVGS